MLFTHSLFSIGFLKVLSTIASFLQLNKEKTKGSKITETKNLELRGGGNYVS
jgi:hypothetical protein